MIQMVELYISLLFLFTYSALSQHQNWHSVNGQPPEISIQQGLYNIQNTCHTYRVSVCKCKEYMRGEDYVDDLKARKIEVNINKVTEHVEVPEKNSTGTETTTITNKISENIDTTSETTVAVTYNYEKTRDVRDTQTEAMYYDSIPAIFGGETAIIGEFPHMAAIGWKNSNGSYSFDCGGSLISPKFVLTAAHCTYSHIADNPVPEVVRLGDHFIDGFFHIETQPIQITIEAIHKHPQYTRKKHYNDIALLELDVGVKFNYNIQPACLWSSRDLNFYSTALATGWGAIDSYSGERPNKLQKVFLHLLDSEICNNSLAYLINKKWDKGFIDSQLCAGEPTGGKDTCQGDSGSPLQVPMLEYPNRYYLIGITSFGPKICAQLPAVYTRVSSYLDWIESKVWPDEYKAWLTNATNH